MKESIANKLSDYLFRTMLVGIVCIVVVATFFSVKSHEKNYKENHKSLQYFVHNVIPAAAHFISVKDMVKLEKRMNYYVQNEQERNLQIQIKNPDQKVIFQSKGYDGKCDFSYFKVRKHVPICDHQEIISSSNQPVGHFYATRNIRSFYSFFIEFFLPAFVVVLFVFVTLFFVMIRRFLKNNIVDPMDQLVQSLEQDKDVHISSSLRNKGYEWEVLSQAIEDYRKRITDYIIKQNKTHADLEKEKVLSELTSQLAYDIQSPLEILDKMASHMPELDGEKRSMIRKATARIHDIANNLLNKSFSQSDDLSLQMISSLVRSMISEKKEQYKDNHKIMIREFIESEMYGVFAKIETNNFKNILSHVIDNAIEAIPNSGFIRIALTQTTEHIVIDVFDNGKGIPAELIQRVTARGFTYNKEGGNGLGLYLADQKMREWGGKLEIESTVNSGTSIKLIFKKERTPAWFVSQILIHEDTQYVILDDDRMIHEMWEDRILQAVQKNIKFLHFDTEKKFEEWFIKANPKDKKIVYLFDYELIGNNNSGLDIIESCGISSHAILVTNHYESVDIQQRCEKIGVRMLPKDLTRIVPIVSA